MTPLRRRMLEELKLAGLSERTQQAYLAAVKRLAHFYHRPPDQINQEQVRAYFLHLIEEKMLSWSTVKQHLCGIKFFYERALQRKWEFFKLPLPKKKRKLPVVLSKGEIGRILFAVKNPTYRMALLLIYCCGLRISEGCALKVAHIDSERMQLRVQDGKGGHDRYVPLPALPRRMLLWSRAPPA